MAKMKKMAFGGPTAPGPANTPTTPTNMPAQSNAGGAMRGQARAAAMSGQTMPTVGAPAPAPLAPTYQQPVASSSPYTGPRPAMGGDNIQYTNTSFNADKPSLSPSSLDLSGGTPLTLPMAGFKKGGKVKKMASGGAVGGSNKSEKSDGVRGWGIARGARKAKIY